MGQAHVRRWTDEILPLLEGDKDPLGVDDLTTHQLPIGAGAKRPRLTLSRMRRRVMGKLTKGAAPCPLAE